VCKNALFPINDGAQRRTYELANYLSNDIGHSIDLICFSDSRGEDFSFSKESKVFDNIFLMKRNRSRCYHLAKRLTSRINVKYIYSELGSFNFKEKISQISNSYDVIYYQGYDSLDLIIDDHPKILVDLLVEPIRQAIESNKISSSLCSNVMKGTHDIRTLKKYLNILYNVSESLIFMTKSDLSGFHYIDKFEPCKAILVPMHTENKSSVRHGRRKYDFIFCGIDNPLNRKAVDEIIPLFMGKYSIAFYGTIVNYINSEDLKRINDLSFLDIDIAHQMCTFSLNIIPYGSGIKTKVLTSLKNQTIPILCDNANNGIGLDCNTGILSESYHQAIDDCVNLDEFTINNMQVNIKTFVEKKLNANEIYKELVKKI
jgi:hypothetical protein